MSGQMSAEYWRAYRARNREKINAADRARRALGRIRGDRTEEYRRRNAQRALPEATPPFTGHSLFDEVRMLLRPRHEGAAWRFAEEVDWEDAMMAGVLASLEGRDPTAATLEVFASTRLRREMEVPLFADSTDE